MRPDFAVIPDDIIRYCMGCFTESYRHPLIFQTSEEALHRTVIPAVTKPAHTFLSGIATGTVGTVCLYSGYPDHCGT